MRERRMTMTRVFEGKREDGQDVDHVDVEGEYGRYIAIRIMSSGKTRTRWASEGKRGGS